MNEQGRLGGANRIGGAFSTYPVIPTRFAELHSVNQPELNRVGQFIPAPRVPPPPGGEGG